MQSKNVSFPNADGQPLSATLDRPLGEPAACALFAHCFDSSKDAQAAANISRSMTAADIAVLRLESRSVADVLAAAAWLVQEHRAPDMLFGHALGGPAILRAAAQIPSAVAVATIGSPADADLATVAADLRKALLVVHAPLDDVVDIDNASTLFVAAKHPKSFVSLDRADHLLSHADDSSYAGRVLAAWASRYLPAEEEDDALSAEPGEVYARTTIDSFATDVRAGHHSFVADEPIAVGGTDTGPTPYDLLAAALATCTSMTLKMYARHKKLDLRSATVRVTHGRIHAEDCEDCSKHEGMIHQFRRQLRLVGDLDNEQRQRMLEIADRCPVHKTLHDEIKIRTQLAR